MKSFYVIKELESNEYVDFELCYDNKQFVTTNNVDKTSRFTCGLIGVESSIKMLYLNEIATTEKFEIVKIYCNDK